MLDRKTISAGKTYDLKSALVPNKFTLVYFYASWCPFCQKLDVELEKGLAARKDVAIRVVNIVNWESDTAKQGKKDFTLDAVPYVRVYGPDGKFIGHISGNDIKGISALLKLSER